MKRMVFAILGLLLMAVNLCFAAGDLIVDGRVSIGTATLTSPLTVVSNGANAVSIDGNSTNSTGLSINNSADSGRSWGLASSGGGPSPAGSFVLFDNTASTARMVVDASGNVGIGMTSPLAGLHITKTGAPGGALMITNQYAPGTTNFDYPDGKNYIRGTTVIADLGGNVGIGTNSPSFKLDVAGIIRATNITPPSDRKFKDNIRGIESSLNKVLSIEGVTFDWKRDEFKDMNFPDGRHYGVIAQEIEKVLPEIVLTASDGSKSVAYMEIIPVLIEAIKEFKTENDDLKERLLVIERRLDSK